MSAKRLRRFFFGTEGAKKKLCKKKAPLWGFRRLRAATKATRLGCAPPFEKGGRKLSKKRRVVVLPTFLPTLFTGDDLTLR